MKNIVKVTGLGLIVILSVQYSCNEEKPTLTTSAITNITDSSAISGGTIISEGSGTLYERGVCWSTSNNPNEFDDKTTDGIGIDTFISKLSGLTGATFM